MCMRWYVQNFVGRYFMNFLRPTTNAKSISWVSTVVLGEKNLAPSKVGRTENFQTCLMDYNEVYVYTSMRVVVNEGWPAMIKKTQKLLTALPFINFWDSSPFLEWSCISTHPWTERSIFPCVLPSFPFFPSIFLANLVNAVNELYCKVTNFRPVPISRNWFVRTDFCTFEGLKTKLYWNSMASKQNFKIYN